MGKSAEAFRTISEVAEELVVPKHVLRFWEIKFAHIRPMKRGGGRRFYRPEDMELLRAIRNLLHREGYTIRGVQKLLREQGVDVVKQRSKSQSASTAKARTKRTRVPHAPEARVGGDSAPSRNADLVPAGEVRRRILTAIAELEACQAILSDRAAQPPARTRGRSATR